MPEKLHRKLAAQAKKKFPNNKRRQNSYVYGTLDKVEKKRKSKR